MADKSPGAPAAQVPFGAADLSKANSPNHSGAGQNVLYGDGHVEFRKTPYCGVSDDNIYTARAPKFQMTTQPATLPASVTGVVGFSFDPVQADDSYLVPSAMDLAPAPVVIKPVAAPATAPTATSTSAPAATQ
jgi:prepilin-type processing-associated H-X9-DG protein